MGHLSFIAKNLALDGCGVPVLPRAGHSQALAGPTVGGTAGSLGIMADDLLVGIYGAAILNAARILLETF